MAGYVRRKASGPDVIGTERRPASDVPTPPRRFDADLKYVWRELWRTPVAATWSVNDERLVATLCRLHVAMETGQGRPEQVAGQIANIGSQLGLSPRSRITLSIETRPQPVESETQGRGAFTVQSVA
jgi:hypothetical protein